MSDTLNTQEQSQKWLLHGAVSTARYELECALNSSRWLAGFAGVEDAREASNYAKECLLRLQQAEARLEKWVESRHAQ